MSAGLYAFDLLWLEAQDLRYVQERTGGRQRSGFASANSVAPMPSAAFKSDLAQAA